MGHSLIYRFKVVFLLGLSNSLFAFWYKFRGKLRFRNFYSPNFPILNFDQILKVETLPKGLKLDPSEVLVEADKIVNGELRYFANTYRNIGNPPDWFLNPTNGKRLDGSLQYWKNISDFNSGIGDIKCVWEASRFEWVLILTRAYIQTNNEKYLETLNSFVKDWIEKNPTNMGVNWKCGQEASIRCFHLIIAWVLLGRPKISTTLKSFLEVHAERIESNIKYALCQDNNHGTSEAAALYLIGLIIKNRDAGNTDAERWYLRGREILEVLAGRLIQNDGSFSQNSINYHRVLIETLNTIEAMRIVEVDEKFSNRFYERCSLATLWLYQFVDDETGRVPNLGANDGALICRLHSCSFEDYRPTVQLSSVLFLGKKVFKDGIWDEPLYWYGLKSDFSCIQKESIKFGDGGYGILRLRNASLFFRAPKYNFRPSQADAMHIDLWIGSENYLTDGGTFSYNDPSGTGDILKSAKGHNLIVFDDADPMPKLGPFLYGEWLRGKFEFSEKLITSYFKDYRDFIHERKIQKEDKGFRIIDRVSGKFKKADLYWHLGNQEWVISGNRASFNNISIEVITSGAIELINSPRSNYYQEFKLVNCLKVSLAKEERTIETLIRF